MQDISELERRIAAAFDRIDRGLESADRARVATVLDTSAIVQAQEAAQAQSADWARRYAALEQKSAADHQNLSQEIARLTQALAAPLAELASARQQLAAKTAELVQINSHRSIEIAELKSIVAALTPLIEEA